MREIKMLHEDNFEQVIQDHPHVVVDFYADWCMPCKAMEPLLLEFAFNQNQVIVTKVDVDTHMDIALAYDVTNIPTILCFKHGKLHQRWTGVISLTELESCIEN